MSSDFLLRRIQEDLEMLVEVSSREATNLSTAGEPSPYPDILVKLGHVIRNAEYAHRVIGQMARHTHEWNDYDYCSVCGADGRS